MNKIDHNELSTLTAEIRDIANEAGNKILEIYETEFTVENKEDDSPLTAADLAAHTTIYNRLRKLTPEIPVLSEESTNINFTERSGWQQYWLVDPLDGTREFIKRNGEFSVNIALIEKHRSILGVIHIPVTHEAYSASLNNGAYYHQQHETSTPISVKPTDPETITVAGSRSHGNRKLRDFIDRLPDPEILSIGSSLKFCLVAHGKADIYPRFGPTSEWDTAAAQSIVEEAGGVVVDLQFNKLEYNTKDSLLNPAFLVIADQNFDWSTYVKEL